MGRFYRLTLVMGLGLLLGGVLGACHPRNGSGLPIVSLRVGGYTVQAEVASTDLEQEIGLMFRTRMAENDGMLFVFRDSARRAFWMKNTLLPLTVAFIDEKGVLINLEDMLPQTEDPHWSKGPAKYALEMNQGWFAKRKLLPGVQVEGIETLPMIH